MTEKQLIEGCRNGERLAQKELYETYSRKMMGVCLRYVSDRETARDLIQDGFVRGGFERSLSIVRWSICANRMFCVKQSIWIIRWSWFIQIVLLYPICRQSS